MVCSEAIFQAVRAARILRNVPSDRADDLARRVGSVVQLVGSHRRGYAEVGHARLDDRALVLRVDGEDLPHPGQPNDDPVGDGQRTAGQTGACTAGDERNPFAGADAHDRRDLLGARRQHNQRRNHPEAGQPVAFIGAKLSRFRDEAAFADQPGDLSAYLRGDPPGGLLGDQVEIGRCHGHRPLNQQPARRSGRNSMESTRARSSSMNFAQGKRRPSSGEQPDRVVHPLQHRERRASHHFRAAITCSSHRPTTKRQALGNPGNKGVIGNPDLEVEAAASSSASS